MALTYLSNVTIAPGTKSQHCLTGTWAMLLQMEGMSCWHTLERGSHEKHAEGMYHLILYAEPPPTLPATFYLRNRFMVLKNKANSSNEFILNTEAKLAVFFASVTFYNESGYGFVSTFSLEKDRSYKVFGLSTFLCEPPSLKWVSPKSTAQYVFSGPEKWGC